MKNTTSSINEGELESQNPQVKWYIITFLSLLYGTISVVSVIGNGLIIYTVAANKKIQFIINIFICNLAVSDIIIGVLVAPFQFQTALLQKWIFPRIACKIAPFAATLSVNVSILTLVAISLDRYHEILSPANSKKTNHETMLQNHHIHLDSVNHVERGQVVQLHRCTQRKQCVTVWTRQCRSA